LQLCGTARAPITKSPGRGPSNQKNSTCKMLKHTSCRERAHMSMRMTQCTDTLVGLEAPVRSNRVGSVPPQNPLLSQRAVGLWIHAHTKQCTLHTRNAPPHCSGRRTSNIPWTHHHVTHTSQLHKQCARRAMLSATNTLACTHNRATAGHHWRVGTLPYPVLQGCHNNTFLDPTNMHCTSGDGTRQTNHAISHSR
jgi:hypothetical protein